MIHHNKPYAQHLGGYLGKALKRKTISSSSIDLDGVEFGADNQLCVAAISSSITIANGYKGATAQTYESSVILQIGNDVAGYMIHAAYDLSWLYIRVGYSAWRSWKKFSLT